LAGPAGPKDRATLWLTDMLFIAAYWRFMFACRQTYEYFNIISNKSQKKTARKAPFLVILFPIEIRTLSPIISLKYAEFLALMGNSVLGRGIAASSGAAGPVTKSGALSGGMVLY